MPYILVKDGIVKWIILTAATNLIRLKIITTQSTMSVHYFSQDLQLMKIMTQVTQVQGRGNLM